MSNQKGSPIPEGDADAESIKELSGDIPTPKRGRPGLGRSKSIRASFTDEEFDRILVAAAKERLRPNEWLRKVALSVLPKDD